ncbi:hypothetical protein BKA60DRAFT_211288 [Fusarium oxysporum]|nr:hypothetical protein BKA60DRAFT_211288 [Fusarium oxysporum]
MVLSIGVLRCRTPSLVLCCAVLFAVLYCPPRSTSLFGRTHSRPSGKVKVRGACLLAGEVAERQARVPPPSSFRTQYLGTPSSPVLDLGSPLPLSFPHHLRPPTTFSLNLFFASRRELQITKGVGDSLCALRCWDIALPVSDKTIWRSPLSS